jgi:hypothetical protein
MAIFKNITISWPTDSHSKVISSRAAPIVSICDRCIFQTLGEDMDSRKLLAILVINCTLITTQDAQAQSKGLSDAPKATTSQEFINSDCISNNTCNLLSFEIKTYNSHKNQPDDIAKINVRAATMMEGSIRLKNKKSLKEFAVVQYIKGCVYQENQFANEEATISHRGRTRFFFGESIDFSHPNFVIDSLDTDPIYASSPYGRHDYYSIVTQPGRSILFDNNRYVRHLSENPQVSEQPVIKFSDIPTGSSYSELLISEGINKGKKYKMKEIGSMVFKTCVFKTSDVPRDLKPEDTDTSKAIKCFEWSNSHTYKKELNVFESNSAVDPLCPTE